MPSKFVLLALFTLMLASCNIIQVRDIVARENGVRFRMQSASWLVKNWKYQGGIDSENRAHGFGQYLQEYGGPIYEGSGEFLHGSPEGRHRFSMDLVEGYKTFVGGQVVKLEKTRNDMPAHLMNVATVGVAGAAGLANGTGQSQSQRLGGEGVTPITQNYKEGYAYNVTTYVGQYASDKYSFATIYGITTLAVAQQNLEAGRSVYGGDKTMRPGYFHIERVPVTQGSQIRTGIVPVR